MPCPTLPWLRLLAVLLVVGGASQQQQQQPEPYGDWFEALISQAVTAATEPLLRPLTDRLERLGSQLDVLATRLDNQDHKLDGLASLLTTRLDNQDHKLDGLASLLTTRLDNQDHKLDGLTSLLTTRLDNQDHKLDGLTSLLTTRLDNQDHKLDGLTTRLDNQDHKLDGLTTRLDNQDHKLDGLAIKLENCNYELNNHSSKLEGLMVRLDNQDLKMDGLAAKLSSQESKLDEIQNGLATSLSSQGSKLNGLVTTLSNQDAELNELVSSLSSQDSKLNGLVTTLSNQDTELNGLISSLSSQDSKLNGLVTQMNGVYTNISTRAPLSRDCSDMPAGSRSGVQLLQLGLDRSQPPVPAFCDLDNDGGRWTVIQRRADIQPRQNFFRNWAAYKEGFGELDVEFWWGLERLWTVTSAPDRQYELRIDLGDFDDAKRYAVYRSFGISSERDGYRLLAKNYTGNAGDSMAYHDGQRFSTKDKDQDQHSGNCAAKRQGGWWYNRCTRTNLNGPYLSAKPPGFDCISWYTWRGDYYSLKTVEMKIRPT